MASVLFCFHKAKRNQIPSDAKKVSLNIFNKEGKTGNSPSDGICSVFIKFFSKKGYSTQNIGNRVYNPMIYVCKVYFWHKWVGKLGKYACKIQENVHQAMILEEKTIMKAFTND